MRVLIVDDRNLPRSAMEAILDRQEWIEVLGGAVDGEDAVAQAKRHGVDVVLINSLAQTLNVVDTTKQVTTSCGDDTDRTRVLVLSNEVDEDALAAVAAGASGVVLTSIAMQELVLAIRIADVGYLVLPPDFRSHSIIGGPAYGALNNRLASTHDLGALTDRENDILRLLAIGLSNSQISTELVLSESTVKSHVQHILNKLGLPNRVHAVILAYELGLIQIGQNAPQICRRHPPPLDIHLHCDA
ncbi:MAG TPA: response regulator transcription factor [Pseudonocardiaceae bacterium]|nr:response regulator transcription factor [Pseudonocardiaceae bacterium]